MIEDLRPFTCRDLPEGLASLTDLALDVRWTWNHGSDRLWQAWTRRPGRQLATVVDAAIYVSGKTGTGGRQH